MKVQIPVDAWDMSSWQAVQRAAQNRTHRTKAVTHRYERRKVREYLRQAGGLVEEDVPATRY